jgi:hypothetical protein
MGGRAVGPPGEAPGGVEGAVLREGAGRVDGRYQWMCIGPGRYKWIAFVPSASRGKSGITLERL